MGGRIFISYSRTDLKAVKPIKENLEAKEFSCWMDIEGIESGSPEFTKTIAKAINDSLVVLFFLSANSQMSSWSLNELRLAREKNRHVVLVRFNNDRMSDEFKLEFGGADIIDWRQPEQKKKLLRDLSIWSQQEGRPRESDCGTGNDATTGCDGDSDEGMDDEKEALADEVRPALGVPMRPRCDAGMPRRHSPRIGKGLEPRIVVYAILAILALLGVAVYAGVIWCNERRAKNSVEGIRVESMHMKEKIGRISRGNGFGREIDAASDELRKAETFYGAGSWHESAVVFTNYVRHCEELVDLDRERQSAERAKEQAGKALQQAKSQEAMVYAAADWSLAVQTFEKAEDEFRRMEFAADRASCEKSSRQFEECVKVVKLEKKRLEQEEERRRIDEQRRREAEKLAAEQRRMENAEKLAKLRAGIKIKVKDAKVNMEKIADFRADPVGFMKHLDNADGQWKYVDVVETNPATVSDAEGILKLVGESERAIANELEWLKANKVARDDAKSVEEEIARDIDPELKRVDAVRYAKKAFIMGKDLRDDGNNALAQGDFAAAKKCLLEAKAKLLVAIDEAKSPWASDVWKKIEPEVLAIRLQYEKHMGRNLLVAHVPQSGFDLGDAQLQMRLTRGTNVVDEINNVTFAQGEGNSNYRRVEMKCSARRTRGIDAYVLRFSYQSLPIDLRFIPTIGVNIEAGKFDQDVSSFALASVSFMGDRRELLGPVPQIQCDIIMAISNNLNRAVRSEGKHLWALSPLGALLEVYATRERVNINEVVKALRFSPSLTEVQTNGLLYVQANAQDYNIAYTNESPSKCRVVIDATFLNPCGAQIFTARDDKKLGAWEGGESILSMPRSMKGCELPSYVILKCTRK